MNKIIWKHQTSVMIKEQQTVFIPPIEMAVTQIQSLLYHIEYIQSQVFILIMKE